MKKYAGHVERAFLLFDIYYQNQQHVLVYIKPRSPFFANAKSAGLFKKTSNFCKIIPKCTHVSYVSTTSHKIIAIKIHFDASQSQLLVTFSLTW